MTAAMAAAIVPAAAATASPARGVIPFVYEEARLYVPVKSGRRDLGSFILDSGSSRTTLDSGLQPAVRVALSGSRTAAGAGRGTLAESTGGPLGLQIGGVSLALTSTAFAPLDGLLAPFSGRHVHGIVGGDLLERHIATVDFDKREVDIRPAVLPYRGAGIRLPIELISGVPVVQGRIELANGESLPLRLLVDLGAKANLLISEPFVAEHRLLDKMTPSVAEPLGAGLGGETRYAFARLAKLEIGAGGGVSASHLIVGLSVNGTLRGGYYDGLLGARFLQRFRVTFDYSRKLLVLKPRRFGPDRFDRSGLFLTVAPEDMHRFIVHDIVPGSPADEAGLKRNDVIVAAARRSARAWTLPRLRSALASDRATLPLLIRRDGRRLALTLKLRDLL